jgi:hypothetical protein
MNLAGIPIITLFDGRKERQNETKQKRKEKRFGNIGRTEMTE